MDRIAAEAIYRQLAPIEGVKLAIARGYIPKKVEVPTGFVAGQDGKGLVPQSVLESMQKAQQIMAGGKGNEPMPAPAPQPGGGPQLDPAMLAQMMAAQGGGMPMAPETTPPADLGQFGMPPQLGGGMAQGALPPGMGQLDPQMLSNLYQAIMGQMQPQPVGTGNPTGMPNVANMQALAGIANDDPNLIGLAGSAPQIKMPGGF